ncbi:MAG: hypothetical protein WCO60_00965 [Verrucomicrobiota bacterium]
MKTRFLPISLALTAIASSHALAQLPGAVKTAQTSTAPLTAADIFFSEDFEATPVGEIPKGFTKSGAVAVAEDFAHGGKHALKLDSALKGARTINLGSSAASAIGGEHWGRLYYRVKLPTPLPVVPEGKTSAGIHTTLVSGKATSPLANDPIEVRLAGTSTGMDGSFKYLYNVQTKLRGEFGLSAKTPLKYSDQWTLIEWHADNATQTYQFFVNGQEVPEISFTKGAGQFEKAEIPASFDSMSFGWLNYQPASGEGFTAWIDDLVLAKKRIGGGPVPETMGIRK